MDLDALEELVASLNGRVKVVYTIPVHHNPTSVTMSEAKRERLVALARRYGFLVAADEVYQLLNFPGAAEVVPLFYHDDPRQPRVLSIGTLSKLVGPGLKVGWLQAHPSLLEPIGRLGHNWAGGNAVPFSSGALTQFVRRGGLKEHVQHVSDTLARRCELVCRQLRARGLKFKQPRGGYFVWVRTPQVLGMPGTKMALDGRPFAEYRRLCFACHDDAELATALEGVETEL